MKKLFLMICMLSALIFTVRAEKVTVTISVLEPGTLNEVLGDRALDMDSLIVSGNLNKADFEALASYGSYERYYGLNLKDCVLENNELPTNAIAGSRIADVTLPYDVEIVGVGAFCCTRLNRIELPSTVKELGRCAFMSSQQLKTVILPEDAPIEILSESCFNDCLSLKEIKLPKSVRILEAACLSHTQLKEIELPESVEYIGYGAFWLIHGLEAIKSHCITPPETDGSLLEFDNKFSHEILYVPVGCGEVYRAHPEWGKFESIIESAELGTSGVKAVKAELQVRVVGNVLVISSEAENVAYSVYDAQGVLISSGTVNGSAEVTGLSKGCYIVKCGDSTTKVII